MGVPLVAAAAVVGLGTLAARDEPPWFGLLRAARALWLAAAALVSAGAALLILESGPGGGLDAHHWPLMFAGVTAVSLLEGRRHPRRRTRAVVIGPAAVAETLVAELAAAGISRYEVVGHVAEARGSADPGQPCPWLGGLRELRSVVASHRVDLLLIANGTPRESVFDELIAGPDVDVRVCALAAFYETVFGQVPTAEINSAWCEYVMHPRFRSAAWWRRPLDVTVAIVGLIAFGPLLLALALLLRRDGPALYVQERIGEHGRHFRLFKLRTMRWEPDRPSEWTVVDDPRITRIGRFLRASHLDELPQLWNVLRGDMTLVGPRPEQPHYVARLERMLPLYQRRHLIKPGLTGWAQVRCGYAGSELGSAWKLCHDLYYLKHASFAFNVAILIETVVLLLLPRDAIALRRMGFVLVGQEEVPR